MLVFLKRPGDQSQFSSFLASQTEPGRFETMLDWITENLDANLATPALAARACMSERSFRRRFEADLGMPVQQYIARARLNKARRLLESTASPLAAIAADCGFGSPDALRYAFTTQLNVTPSDYRRRFGGASGGV
jgi:transcriptional regulator GlxA family with amidase domain